MSRFHIYTDADGIHRKTDAPVRDAGHPFADQLVRPTCIGAAWRTSFELITNLTSAQSVLKAAFDELPLAANGWDAAKIEFLGDRRWRLSRSA